MIRQTVASARNASARMHGRTLAGLLCLALLAACADETDRPIRGSVGGSDATSTGSADAGDTNANAVHCVPNCDGPSCLDGCGGHCDGKPCDDHSDFSSNDRCKLGVCVGVYQFACNDGNPCTAEQFVEGAGCTTTPLSGATCNDGDRCTLVDRCEGGTCFGFGALPCVDDKACTTNDCDPQVGCTFTAVGKAILCASNGFCQGTSCCSCPDGLACNAAGACVAATSCKGRCGTSSPEATCQCHDGCTAAGNCCDDRPLQCENCAPDGQTLCVGDELLQFNTCLQQVGAKPCTFGCDPGAATCRADPCNGVSAKGQCLSDSLIGGCYFATGDGAAAGPKMVLWSCDPFEVCDSTSGTVTCEPASDVCEPGAQQCDPEDADLGRTCGADGDWHSMTCAGCTATGMASAVACPGAIATQSATLTVRYDHVTLSKLGVQASIAAATPRPAAGVVVYAMRKSATKAAPTLLGAGIADADGHVSLQVPSQPTAEDVQVLAAIGYDGPTPRPTFAVLRPSGAVGSGTNTDDPIEAGNVTDGEPHAWARAQATAKPEWTVSVAASAGALQIFSAIRADRALATKLWGGAGATVVAFYEPKKPNTCGTCFYGAPVKPASLQANFASQFFIGGDDAAARSDAVLHHELGHWAMKSFGQSPREGGTHYLGTRLPPGQAWSEGWASFFSSMARGDALYIDGDDDGVFWGDLGLAQTGSGKAFLPFAADEPMVQFSDELRISSALWQAAAHGPAPWLMPTNQPFATALASDQMLGPTFGRGYVTHVWDSVTPGTGGKNNATFEGYTATAWPAPCFADYLDALLCLAPTLGPALKMATAPLPYPFDAPICAANAPRSPFRATLDATGPLPSSGVVALKLRVDCALAGPAPLRIALTLPAGARLVQGEALESSAWTEGGAVVRGYQVAYDTVPAGDVRVVLDWQQGAVGAHAELPFRFGRPVPAAEAPMRMERPLGLPGGVSLGRPVWML